MPHSVSFVFEFCNEAGQDGLTVSKLKECCRERLLKATGRKEELRENPDAPPPGPPGSMNVVQ